MPHIITWPTLQKFDYDLVSLDTIHIHDIAQSLSMQCRFNGHSSVFYSVAQHSVRVASEVGPELALAALLHDAAEAYVCDLPTPLKMWMRGHESAGSGWPSMYDQLEERIQDAINAKFLPRPLTKVEEAIIKKADDTLYEWEECELRPGGPYDTGGGHLQRAWGPFEAYNSFLNTFWELYGTTT
jgi:uncharacterized protein